MPWLCQRLNATTCRQSGKSKRGISRIGVRLQPVTLCVCHSMCGCATRIQRAPAPHTLECAGSYTFIVIHCAFACSVLATLCILNANILSCKRLCAVWRACNANAYGAFVSVAMQDGLSKAFRSLFLTLPYVLQFFRLQRVVVSLVPLHTQHKPLNPER